MLSLGFLALSISALSLSTSSVYGSNVHDNYHPRFNRQFHPRNYITADQRSASYDFVIAGGGVAGLVIASRLSENTSTTVLVLEAGLSGDDVADQINVPSATYYDSLLNAAPYDYVYETVAQSNAGDRAVSQPRGRVLGGSSAVNGLYLIRPTEQQVTTWHDLIAPNDATAADQWSWDSFFAAMKSSENFTAPVAAAVSVAAMTYNASSRGSGGNLQATYPDYMVPVSSSWLPALEAAGISLNDDAYSGENIGGFFATSTINPANWTRSYSKSAYIDLLPPRSNLHIISSATVERIVFGSSSTNGSLVATGVQFSSGEGTAVQNVTVNKEVLVAGGAYGSPQILQLSGIGPTDILTAAGVTVNLELPGVGQHLLDHLSAGVFWDSNVDTQGSIEASNSTFSQTAEFNSFVNSGVAYINGTLLFGGADSFATFISGIENSTTAAATLSPSQDASVVAGYKAVYDAVLQNNYPTSGLVEILFSINAASEIAVQAALQQPLSQGRVYITSSSVYDHPLIDPQYFSHPADIVLLRQGIKLARQIGAASPLSTALGAEVTPGSSVSTDDEIETWLRSSSGTEYHPCGACAMLPEDQGGVVDANLKVYGTSNVRVVDSSVFPSPFSAHLMAPTYALAEKAASIISAAYAVTSSASSTSAGSATTISGSAASASTTAKSGALSRTQSSSWGLGLIMSIPFIASLVL